MSNLEKRIFEFNTIWYNDASRAGYVTRYNICIILDGRVHIDFKMLFPRSHLSTLMSKHIRQ